MVGLRATDPLTPGVGGARRALEQEAKRMRMAKSTNRLQNIFASVIFLGPLSQLLCHQKQLFYVP